MFQEEIIKEQKTEDAMAKDFFGTGSKFIKIARVLGEPIVSYEKAEDNYFEEDPFYNELKQEGEIDLMSENDVVDLIGWHFYDDSSKIEIKTLITTNETKVHFFGKLVYSEMDGELLGFVSKCEWEEKIENFYQKATKKEIENKKKLKKEEITLLASKKNKLLKDLEEKWGI